MDRERTLFYGFLVSFALTLIPLPDFSFWNGMTDFLEFVVHDLPFVLAVVFAVPLLWSAGKRLFNR